MTSRHSYDVYKAEMKRIREKSKQYAYTHEYFRKTALTSFRTILDALRREYEQGMTPLLSQLLRTHCMIDPELLDYWDFFLYDSLSNATLDLQREIVEKAGKKPHASFSDKHVSILLNQITKLHERYLAPPEESGGSVEAALSEEQIRLDKILQQKQALQQELTALREDREAAAALLQQRDGLQQEIRELHAERERISLLNLEKHDVERELAALKAERDAAAAQTQQQESAALSRAERKINVLEQEKQELQEELEELRVQAEDNSKKADTAALSRAERKINVLEQEKRDLQEELEELRESLDHTPHTEDSLREEADAALEAEKAWLLEELERETGFAYRFDGTAVRSDEVREMVAGRRAFEEELVSSLNATNRSFRDSTAEAASAMQAACEEVRRVLEAQTNSAINAVVDTSRKLQGTDFHDLLEAFRSLETQVYYKSRSGEDSAEFKEYWKSVRFFLKKLESTLNKLGFLRYVPEVGAELDPERMEALENPDAEYPVDAEEYPLFTVGEIVSAGFLGKDGDYPELKALVLAAYKED